MPRSPARRRSSAAAAAKSTGGPVAGCGSRLGTAPQRPRAGTLDCSQADAGAADRAGPAALRNGVDGHFFGFRGVPWSTPAGLEGAQGAAERPTVTPSGPLTARWRCLTVVEGSECRDRRRGGAHSAAAAAKSTGGPVAGCGSRLGTATQRPLAGTLDCSRGRRRCDGPGEASGAERRR